MLHYHTNSVKNIKHDSSACAKLSLQHMHQFNINNVTASAQKNDIRMLDIKKTIILLIRKVIYNICPTSIKILTKIALKWLQFILLVNSPCKNYVKQSVSIAFVNEHFNNEHFRLISERCIEFSFFPTVNCIRGWNKLNIRCV